MHEKQKFIFNGLSLSSGSQNLPLLLSGSGCMIQFLQLEMNVFKRNRDKQQI